MQGDGSPARAIHLCGFGMLMTIINVKMVVHAQYRAQKYSYKRLNIMHFAEEATYVKNTLNGQQLEGSQEWMCTSDVITISFAASKQQDKGPKGYGGYACVSAMSAMTVYHKKQHDLQVHSSLKCVP
eukprot:1860261-Amphidinium_carterae.1